MGAFGWLWFGGKTPEDEAIIDAIAKAKHISKELAEKHYLKMLKGIHDETEDKDVSKD